MSVLSGHQIDFLLTNLPHPDTILAIGKPVPTSEGYDRDYYVDRIFCIQRTVLQEIVDAISNGDFPDLIAYSEEQFKQMCESSERRNIHWIHLHDGRWIWQQSYGTTLDSYMYPTITKMLPITPSIVWKNHNTGKIGIIADTAGMGKSTVITHTSKSLKLAQSNFWVVRIDLNDHHVALDSRKGGTFTTETAVEFLGELLDLKEDSVEKVLYNNSLTRPGDATLLRTAVFIDGFDEVSPRYQKEVTSWLVGLNKSGIQQLWVTTRPHLQEKLEEALQSYALRLEPFSRKNQIDFLAQFWKKNTNVSLNGRTEHLFRYATQVVTNWVTSTKDYGSAFIGIPLQARLLATTYQAEVNLALGESRDSLQLPDTIQLFKLYQDFIEKKIEIFVRDKAQLAASNVAADSLAKSYADPFRRMHQEIAVEVIFGVEQCVMDTLVMNHGRLCDERIYEVGLVQSKGDNKRDFIHRTFAEYFAADFFINTVYLTHPTQLNINNRELLENVLSERDYAMVRKFLNDGLLSAEPSERSVLMMYGNSCASAVHDDNVFANLKKFLFLAVNESNIQIIAFFLKCAKSYPDAIKKLVLVKDQNEKTIINQLIEKEDCSNADMRNKARDMNRLLSAVEEVVGFEYLGQLLLEADSLGKTSLYTAVQQNNPVLVQLLLEFGKRVGNEILMRMIFPEEGVWIPEHCLSVCRALWWHSGYLVNRIFALANLDVNGITLINRSLKSASDGSSTRLRWPSALRDIYDIAISLLTRAYLSGLEPNDDLVSRVICGVSRPFHRAAERGAVDIVRKLLNAAKSNSDETLTTLLLEKDLDGRTALMCAIGLGKYYFAHFKNISMDLLRVLSWGEEKQKIGQLLLAIDDQEQTILRNAAWSDVTVVKEILNSARGCNQTVLTEMLLTTSATHGTTALHEAVKGSTIRELKIFFSQPSSINAKGFREQFYGDIRDDVVGYLGSDAMSSDLLIAFHHEIKESNSAMIELLLATASHCPRGTAKQMILARNEFLQNALHVAAKCGYGDGTTVLLRSATELGRKVFMKLILEKDSLQKTPLHYACTHSSLASVVELLRMAPIQTRVQIIKRVLLTRDFEGFTALHIAVGRDDGKVVVDIVGTIMTLWPDICSDILLAKDRQRQTALHRATKRCNAKAIQNILTTALAVGGGTLKRLVAAKDLYGRTALHGLAWWNCRTTVVHLFMTINKATDGESLKDLLFLRDGYGSTILHMVAEENRWDCVAMLYEKNDTYGFVNQTAVIKSKAMFHAILAGAIQIGQITLKDMLLAKDLAGRTAVHRAILSGASTNVREYLLAVKNLAGEKIPRDVLVEAGDNRFIALHEAAKLGDLDVIQELLQSTLSIGKDILCQTLLMKDGSEEFPINKVEPMNFEVIRVILNAANVCDEHCLNQLLESENVKAFLLQCKWIPNTVAGSENKC